LGSRVLGLATGGQEKTVRMNAGVNVNALISTIANEPCLGESSPFALEELAILGLHPAVAKVSCTCLQRLVPSMILDERTIAAQIAATGRVGHQMLPFFLSGSWK